VRQGRQVPGHEGTGPGLAGAGCAAWSVWAARGSGARWVSDRRGGIPKGSRSTWRGVFFGGRALGAAQQCTQADGGSVLVPWSVVQAGVRGGVAPAA
jgi:hypothetical protein